MTTNYAGIDYGLGKTNIDANGIRFGVISQNSLNPEALDDIFSNAIEDSLNDQYESNGDSQYLYEGDSLRIETCLSNDLIVTKSPFFTYAQFCSPCVPGACNLDSPFAHSDDADPNNRCYCLGHDWFDDGKAPYPVYSVATGQIIQPVA